MVASKRPSSAQKRFAPLGVTEYVNRVELATQNFVGTALQPVLKDGRIDLSKIGVMLEISVL